MKKILFLFSAALLLLSSCGSKNAERMLQTVPSDSGLVTLIRLDNLASKLDDNGRSQLDKALAGLSKRSNEMAPLWQYFFSEDSEVDFSSSLVFFNLGRSFVATFNVKDAGAFCKAIEEKTGLQFQEESGVKMLSNHSVFVKDSQAWYTPEYPEVSAADIAKLTSLKESDSFLSRDCASRLTGEDNDVAALFNISSALDAAYDRQSRMAFNMLFDDPAFLYSSFNFEKDAAVIETVILNSKNEPAAVAFKTEEINASDLKKFPGRGNLFAALGADPEMMANIIRQIKSFTMLPPEMEAVLSQLDGDIVYSANFTSKSEKPGSMALMLSFKSEDAAEKCAGLLRQLGLVDEGGQISTDATRCIVLVGDQTGETIDSAVDALKGARMGAVMLPSFISNMESAKAAEYIDGISCRLEDEGDGAKIIIKLQNKKKGNSLLTFLEVINNL